MIETDDGISDIGTFDLPDFDEDYFDFDLSEHLVPQCIYRGGICPEPKSCGYNTSDRGIEKIKEYKNLMGN